MRDTKNNVLSNGVKKCLVAGLIVVIGFTSLAPSALAVSFDSDLPGNPADAQASQDAALDAKISSLTDAGDQVGCSDGSSLGGALINAFGVGLQQAIPGLIRNGANSIAGKIISKAGPLAPVASTILNIGINKLTTLAQNYIGKIFGGALGPIGSVIGGGNPAAAAAVPVNTVSINSDVQAINTQTDKTQKDLKVLKDKECQGDRVARKMANALISLVTRQTIDFVNNGCDGNSCLIQNLQQFFHTGIEAVAQEVIEDQTAGICAPNRPTVQAILLAQYQYETNVGKHSQCTTDAASPDAAHVAESVNESMFNLFAHAENTIVDAVITKESDLRVQAAQQKEAIALHVAADGLYQPLYKCVDGQPAKGERCKNNDGYVIIPPDVPKNELHAALQTPKDQLLNADEIGEIIDALMASLTQVAFKSVDGILGLSKKSGNQGSYLDQLVGDNATTATGGAQDVVAGDIQNALTVEQQYHDILATVSANLTATRKIYTDAIACYQTKTNNSTATLDVQLQLSNASSTVATTVDPLIRGLTTQVTASQNTVDELEILVSQAQSALTTDDVVAVNNEYKGLVLADKVHTANDLALLQSDLQSTVSALNALTIDATQHLTQCQAL